MITLLAMAGMQPGMIAYDPNLRRYKDGDRWVYTLQGAGLALHTYTVDLVFAKDLLTEWFSKRDRRLPEVVTLP